MREQKGITLIALVITIIVLLILAGVTIAMLTGDNGILSRASEAKYDNVLASVDENVKLAQLSLKTTITSKMVSDTGYIATKSTQGKHQVTGTDAYFDALVKEVAKDLGLSTTTAPEDVSKEGYTVTGKIDRVGDESHEGTGYIFITYSDNALRSSLPKTVATSPFSANGMSYKTSLTDAEINQATVVYAIKVDNYDCSLCKNGGITSYTKAKSDFDATAFEGTTSHGLIF